MKKIVCVVMILFVSFSAFSFEATEVNKGLNEFSQAIFDTMPNVNTQVGNWPDAWVGKFFPSLPPHFGVGFSAGFGVLDTAGFNTAANELGIKPIDSLLIPTFAVDARIGGLFLPFDIGLSFMTLDKMDVISTPISMDFLVVGASLRYAILEGNVILPQVSAGIGYVYNETSIGASGGGSSLSNTYKSQTIYAEAQISKNILFITPYFNARFMLTEAENAWAWKALGGSNTSTIKQEFLDDPRLQLNLGTSFNFLIVQFSVGASYDVLSSVAGFNTSLRVKL